MWLEDAVRVFLNLPQVFTVDSLPKEWSRDEKCSFVWRFKQKNMIVGVGEVVKGTRRLVVWRKTGVMDESVGRILRKLEAASPRPESSKHLAVDVELNAPRPPPSGVTV